MKFLAIVGILCMLSFVLWLNMFAGWAIARKKMGLMGAATPLPLALAVDLAVTWYIMAKIVPWLIMGEAFGG